MRYSDTASLGGEGNEKRSMRVRLTSPKDPTKFYTKGEEVMNAVTHGMGSLLAIIGTSVLITLCAVKGTAAAVAVSAIYGASLILLYTMSTLYHAFPFAGVKKLFRVFDHSTIYLLIAGSYTPFTLVLLEGSTKGVLICAVVWAAALLGVVLNAISVDRFAIVSMILYVTMGWAAVAAFGDIIRALPTAGFALMLAGGICYTGGILFYALKVRYMHGVWHLFVLAGSVLHYICVFCYVMPLWYVK